MLSLPPEMRQALKNRLVDEETIKRFPYTDSLGNLSIGLGRDIQHKGISVDEALYLADNDIMDAEKEIWHYCPWYAAMDDVRKTVIVDMVYNEGIGHLLGFKKMIACIQAQDWTGAAHEMVDSLWFKQVGKRASHLALIMETGVL